MAMTSQTYSLIPSSISASGYSTPTNVPNGTGGGSQSSLFSSSGSPPLIVAFLAIGLFIVAMLGVFAWRRISQSRYRQPTAINRQPEPVIPSKRPILCDVWAGSHVPEKSPPGATRWENMTPVAAILTFLPVEPPMARHRQIGFMDSGGRVLLRTLRRFVSAVKRFYFPIPPPPPPPPPPPERDRKVVGPPASHTSHEIEWVDASSLQVTVIVAMPARPRCRSRTSGEDVGPERIELGEFCIATMDVPCSECG